MRLLDEAEKGVWHFPTISGRKKHAGLPSVANLPYDFVYFVWGMQILVRSCRCTITSSKMSVVGGFHEMYLCVQVTLNQGSVWRLKGKAQDREILDWEVCCGSSACLTLKPTLCPKCWGPCIRLAMRDAQLPYFPTRRST